METKKKRPVLIDNTAAEIISKVDYDFAKLSETIHPVTQFEWIARSIHIDRTIGKFLERHPKATIVNIGCGLDTTFERVDNGKLFWYDLDLPDVIELRRQFIPESERRRFISSSFLEDGWLNGLHVEDNILFMAAGVFYYIEEAQMKKFFDKIAAAFPGSEIVFDAASPLGVQAANKHLIDKVGLDGSSYLKWGVQTAAEITKWNINIEVIREYPIYKGMMKGLKLKYKYMAYMSDKYKIMYMIHLRMNH
jgi:O-methyltransferase involved in polyketide biosynthesis